MRFIPCLRARNSAIAGTDTNSSTQNTNATFSIAGAYARIRRAPGSDHGTCTTEPGVTVLDGAFVLDGVESPIAMRTGRHADGTCEHRLAVPEHGRMRATLRLRLGAMDRPAARL